LLTFNLYGLKIIFRKIEKQWTSGNRRNGNRNICDRRMI